MAKARVVRAEEVKVQEFGAGKRFKSRGWRLGDAAGGERLGCSLYEVPPGCTAFPFHAHYALEEALYVLEGTGTLRLGDERIEVGPGSYAAFPVGKASAHQILNTGTVPLKYLCMSAGRGPEVVVYPDSGKIGASAGGWPPEVRVLVRPEDSLQYWDGEDVDGEG